MMMAFMCFPLAVFLPMAAVMMVTCVPVAPAGMAVVFRTRNGARSMPSGARRALTTSPSTHYNCVNSERQRQANHANQCIERQ